MKYKRLALHLTMMTVLVLACQLTSLLGGNGGDTQGTTTAKADDVLATNAQATLDMMATQDTQASPTPVPATPTADLQATQAQETQAALDSAATSTGEALAAEQTATAEVLLQTTAEAQDMFSLVQRLQSQGFLTNTNGEYIALADYDQSWAQINWYQWTPTGYSPDNFVIRADFAWSSASDKANWFASGCGFVFGEQDNNNHDVAYLGLDGNVYVARIRNGNWKTISQRYFGKLSIPDGQASAVMIVENKNITFFVNDTKVVGIKDSALLSGELNLTLLSGTNKDFGTRCQITDIGLWVLQ